jgi:rhodanese-related sulfurtransferase
VITLRIGKWPTPFAIVFLLICIETGAIQSAAKTQSIDQPKGRKVEFITPEELKAKVTRKERVTIIDVRASGLYAESDDKIKGAIRVKYRKLRSRLVLAPLKDLPRDQEVVTYCACPSDETSIRAAQLLLESGFVRVRALKGGWQGWLRIGGQLEARQKVL